MKTLKTIFILFLIVFPLGQLLRFQLPFLPASVKFQPVDILTFLFVITWIIKRKEKIIFPSLFKSLAVFAGVAFLSLIFKTGSLKLNDFIPAFFYLIRFLNYLLFYLALYNFLKENKGGKILGKFSLNEVLIGEGLVISILSLLQYFLIPDTRFLFNSGWDRHYFRAIGPFLDPSFNGLIIVLSFIVWLSGLLEGSKGKWFKVLFIPMVISIGLSFSRAVYAVFVLSILIFLFKRKKKILSTVFLLILVVFISVVVISPKPAGEGVNLLRTSSFFLKVDNYKYAFEIIKSSPLFGVGFNTLRSVQRDYGFISQEGWETTNAGAGLDNSFLFVLATTGIFGLIAFFGFWWKTLKEGYKGKVKGEIIFISACAVSVISFSINAVFYPWVFLWLVIVLSVLNPPSRNSSDDY